VRVAVIADVHGNAAALEAVLGELDREAPDLLVSCGDLTWGPQPLEVVRLLEPWLDRALFVRGNSERELIEGGLEESEIVRWQHERHAEQELRDYLERTDAFAIAAVDGLGAVRFCHGSPRSDIECVTRATPADRVRELADGVPERCIVTAHTHMQFDRRVDGLRLLNPGSVGLPYEQETGCAYWALLGPEVELRRTGYDLDTAIEGMRAAGMPQLERIEGMMRTPPSQHEVIEHAERVVFAG
jgi:putative phosphoesterase